MSRQRFITYFHLEQGTLSGACWWDTCEFLEVWPVGPGRRVLEGGGRLGSALVARVHGQHDRQHREDEEEEEDDEDEVDGASEVVADGAAGLLAELGAGEVLVLVLPLVSVQDSLLAHLGPGRSWAAYG